MRKNWRENMVDPPKTCLWVQSRIYEDLYRWETECGKSFENKKLIDNSHFDSFTKCPTCGGMIHMETKEYWGWSI